MSERMIKIYCDGACSGNPGPGAWAYVVFENEKIIASASGVESDTTNNRMELMAAIKALQMCERAVLVLDSKYVKDGITQWIKKWKQNGWKTATGTVKNVELWRQLDALNSARTIDWQWEKGHANNVHDIVDELARGAVLK